MAFTVLLAVFVYLSGLLLCEGSCPVGYCCNGGTCSNTSTSTAFACNCLEGFTGDQCEIVQNVCKGECAYGPCVKQGEGGPLCLCPTDCCTSCDDHCNVTTCSADSDLQLCVNATTLDDCVCAACYYGSGSGGTGSGDAEPSPQGECTIYNSSTPTLSLSIPATPTTTTAEFTHTLTLSSTNIQDISPSTSASEASSTPSSTSALETSSTPSSTSAPEGLSSAVKAVIAVNVIISLILLIGVGLVIAFLVFKWFKTKPRVCPGDHETLLKEDEPKEANQSENQDTKM